MGDKGTRRLIELTHTLIYKRDEVTLTEYEAQLLENLCMYWKEYAKLQTSLCKVQRKSLRQINKLIGVSDESTGDKE